MIRNFDNYNENILINVKLKSGEFFEKMDISSAPLGQNERMVSFWIDGKIRVYPMCDVEYFEYCEE